ncbi:MAG: DUF1992 domain-containing protein [Myxococcota bacterium]|nr:DUF1992 domain-containing protein [Myxococcota bacterium]
MTNPTKPPRRPRNPDEQGAWLDDQVRRAQEDGLFDDLPGAGKPLRNLEEVSDPLWWAKSLMRRERLSVLPPTLEIRGKVEKTLAALPELRREEEVRVRLEALNDEIRKLNSRVHEGPPTRQAPLDVARLVRQWRRERRERE